MSKVAVIGMGSVGSAIVYAMAIQGLAREYVLIDPDERKRHAQALDLKHGSMFVPDFRVVEAGVEGCADADIVIVTAGAKQDPGQTRLDLARQNCGIMRELAGPIFRHAPNSVLLIVTNPVDVVTWAARELAVTHGFDPARVIGSGTVLDTSRLRRLLADRLKVAVQNVHALIAGEHGDSAVPLWSSATVQNCPLSVYCPAESGCLTGEERAAIHRAVRDSAYEIIKGKGATSYAIGLATAHICRAILRDEHAVLTVSSHHEGFAGVKAPACFSAPSVVGRAGVLRVLHEQPLDDAERAGLRTSAETIRKAFETSGFTA